MTPVRHHKGKHPPAHRPEPLSPTDFLPAGYGIIHLDSELGTDLGDRAVWVDQLLSAREAAGKAVPKAVDLENAITDIAISDTMKGSSTITLTLFDDGWQLTDTQFFDMDENGKLDSFECNYPLGSDLWWVCTQVGLDLIVGGPKITMTFMERDATYLMQFKGPLKASRGKTTRAKFLKFLSDHVKAHGGIQFVSQQLDTVQTVGPQTGGGAPTQNATPAGAQVGLAGTPGLTRRQAKGKGISRNANLMISGAKATSAQLTICEQLLDAAKAANAGPKAYIALIEIGIVESTMRNLPVQNDGTGYYSVGVLQAGGTKSAAGVPAYGQDIAKCATFCLKGGASWVQGGGLMALEKQGFAPGDMAWREQQCAAQYRGRYAEHEAEAKAIVAAYGGPGGLGVGAVYTQQYNFDVGSQQKPDENFWDAMQRLALEVKWPLFLDGPRLYFDAETTLIKQVPVANISRDDVEVMRFSSNWDTRHIATMATLELICDPFEFRAGEVFQLDGFGLASTGSTAKPPLPGRWLIEQADRSRFSMETTFQLKQPEAPLPEPPSKLGQKAADAGAGGGPVRDLIVALATASLTTKTNFSYYSQAGAMTADILAYPPKRSDCSQWVRAVYLKAGAGDPGSDTYEMEAKGKHVAKPQPGDLMITSDTGHVEIWVGDGTIGHGSPPIHRNGPSSFPGCHYITFDFLNAGGGTRPALQHRPTRAGHPPITPGGTPPASNPNLP